MAPELTVITDDLLDVPPSSADGSEGSDAATATLDPVITKESDIYAFAMVVIEVRPV